MATPNPDYRKSVPSINGIPTYLDGWETVTTAEWDGGMALPVDDWIGLDAMLRSNADTYAVLTIETPATAPVTYRQILVVYSMSDMMQIGLSQNMATDAPPLDFRFPAGSRLYMSISAEDLQQLFNNQLTVVPYGVVNGSWACLAPFPPRVVNPDGTSYVLPAVGSRTGLILVAFPAAGGKHIALSATPLSLSGTWYKQTDNGAPSEGGPA
ncbi:hypothetical protein NH8B_2117 [Pseudogulbenkiania sp. NH8B]|uniref:hypothetical protein n=1 Tax=Pseudogulbenkiania sp. (strain NH8B) TaxID=748280 RepID=UPI0002279BB9|nr:hypothetical protein [Pseudogulbenkiania sp. NH8B]BAK76503.1 hypothetical protein NH8B_1686 [Pseudogulbenkiania sp. NH8B]BAK76932.1 hypothetical protein NH8B_2117 [Pseudogulbenkiania sp. NH8B]